jgi:hypothetical protein
MTTPITDTIRKAEEEFEKLNLVEFLDHGINGKVTGQIPVFQKTAVKNHIKSTNLALLKSVEEEVGKVAGRYDGSQEYETCRHDLLSFLRQAREELEDNSK